MAQAFTFLSGCLAGNLKGLGIGLGWTVGIQVLYLMTDMHITHWSNLLSIPSSIPKCLSIGH